MLLFPTALVTRMLTGKAPAAILSMGRARMLLIGPAAVMVIGHGGGRRAQHERRPEEQGGDPSGLHRRYHPVLAVNRAEDAFHRRILSPEWSRTAHSGNEMCQSGH